MKKVLNLLLLFVVGFFFVTAVYADEPEIPTEGVHYFLTYPNNESVISEDYADVTKEILLYSGRTNNNGEVVLNDWHESGKIRVVQKVPKGYQTDVDTISVDLSKGNAEFVDYKQTVNPHTGQSLLFLVVIAAILAGTYITVRSPKKKMLMMIPIAALAVASLHVFANSDFTIVVKDKQGNRLANVEVEVYGTPSTVEAAPIVIFKANGGLFLDGTDEMMMKLPFNDCNSDELFSSFTDEDNDYFYGNLDGLTREGYNFAGFDMPELLSDGDIVNILWEEESSPNPPKVVKVNGNGGAYPFNGNELESILVYEGNYDKIYSFVNGELSVAGLDNNPECSNVFGGGFRGVSDTEELYVCWTDEEVIK